MTTAAAAPALLTRREVCAYVGISATTLQRYEAEGEFPKRRRIGPRMSRWLRSEVDEWIAALSTAVEVG